jgi:hypothetical protein
VPAGNGPAVPRRMASRLQPSSNCAFARFLFRSPRRRLSSTRCALARAVGAVRTRGGVTAKAPAMRSESLRRAASRLRACERCSPATTLMLGPKTSRSFERCRGPSEGEPSTSKRSSARVADRLACWPPGPPDESKRHSSSDNGIASERVTFNRSSSATVVHPAPSDEAATTGFSSSPSPSTRILTVSPASSHRGGS